MHVLPNIAKVQTKYTKLRQNQFQHISPIELPIPGDKNM